MSSFFGGTRKADTESRKNFVPGDPFFGHEWNLSRASKPAELHGGIPAGSRYNSTSRQKFEQKKEMAEHIAHEMTNPAESHTGAMPHSASGPGKPAGMSNPAEQLMNETGGPKFLPKSDIFMTKRFNQAKERIKVSIYHATDLVCPSAECAPYVQLQIPNMLKSRLNTPVDYRNRVNPVWNFVEKSVWGWTPDKALQFVVKNKRMKEGGVLSTMFAVGDDQVIGSVTLQPDQYWPFGFKDHLEIIDEHGHEAGKLWIEIQPIGGPKPTRWACAFACDAFATGLGAFEEDIKEIPEHVRETLAELHDWCWKMLDPPYHDRKPSEMYWLQIVPSMIFVVMLFLLCLLQHASPSTVTAIGVIIGLIAIAMIVFSFLYRKKVAGFPLSTLGCFCLLAVALGTWAGCFGWSYSWNQWWWLHTGFAYGGMEASTPAAARVDASSVSFSHAPSLTNVDASRAAGYRNGDIYCAAPILDPNSTLADHIRVNYWAIGINCCDDFGSFTCDSARELSGNIGVVMVDRGMPSAGGHSEYFRLATLKANGIYSMVSSPAALYVRYVKSSDIIDTEYWLRGIFILIIFSIAGCFLFAALGFLANYKGWGKPPRIQARPPKPNPARHAPPPTDKSCLPRYFVDHPPRVL